MARMATSAGERGRPASAEGANSHKRSGRRTVDINIAIWREVPAHPPKEQAVLQGQSGQTLR